MSARVEAALEAFRRERVWQEEETPIRAALAAADKVMFSDAAVERAEVALGDVLSEWPEEDSAEEVARNAIRAVIAALRDH